MGHARRVRHTVQGEIAQAVHVDMGAGDALWVSRGSLTAYTAGVTWRLRVPGGAGAATRRLLAGEGLSLTYVEAHEPGQQVVLSADQPGHVMTWDLSTGPVVATRGAFLAAWGSHIDITATVARRAGAAVFGGAGLLLQRVSGEGQVLVHGSGDFLERELAAGERLVVSTGRLAAFDDTVDFAVEGVGGCRRALFGGEGLFMTRVTGPGRVLLQTLERRSRRTSSTSG